MKAPRVLIACEFSGIVREEFRKAGCDAWSCDLLPTEIEGQHIQDDVLKHLNDGWDLMIAHPPCTYLCNSGVRWLSPGGKLDENRHALMQESCDFFARIYWAECSMICIENPVMHCYAKSYLWLKKEVRDYTCSVQPYEHGHGETKRTCLWLRGLPPLKPTNIVNGRTPRVHFASPGMDRWKERSRTLPGIAKAFAEQWSPLLKNPLPL